MNLETQILSIRQQELKSRLTNLIDDDNPHSTAFAIRILNDVEIMDLQYQTPTADEVTYGGYPTLAGLGFALGSNLDLFPDAKEYFISGLNRAMNRETKAILIDDLALLGLAGAIEQKVTVWVGREF